MSLSLIDCRVRTIVDHTIERHEDGARSYRNPRRRGIIVKVDGDARDSVSGVWVKFKPDEEPIKVDIGELIKVYPADSRISREAYRRVMGEARHVGAEFPTKKAVARIKVSDSLAVTPKTMQGVVLPEDEEIEGIESEP